MYAAMLAEYACVITSEDCRVRPARVARSSRAALAVIALTQSPQMLLVIAVPLRIRCSTGCVICARLLLIMSPAGC